MRFVPTATQLLDLEAGVGETEAGDGDAGETFEVGAGLLAGLFDGRVVLLHDGVEVELAVDAEGGGEGFGHFLFLLFGEFGDGGVGVEEGLQLFVGSAFLVGGDLEGFLLAGEGDALEAVLAVFDARVLGGGHVVEMVPCHIGIDEEVFEGVGDVVRGEAVLAGGLFVEVEMGVGRGRRGGGVGGDGLGLLTHGDGAGVTQDVIEQGGSVDEVLDGVCQELGVEGKGEEG